MVWNLDTNMNMDTVWNLKPDTDSNTDNYPDLEVLKFRISVTLKYIDGPSINPIQN
jgi:hypothetical protein